MQREQWHLTEGLIFAHFAVFILGSMMEGGQQALALIPGFVTARPWTLVTYQFVHGSSMFMFFISMLILWIMARPLEESWGSPRFLVFWLGELGLTEVSRFLAGCHVRRIAYRGRRRSAALRRHWFRHLSVVHLCDPLP